MTPEEALASIPGWAGADVTPLPGGTTGRTWLAETGGRRAVLKVDPAPRVPPLNRRDEEAAIQASAAEAGLAPAVLYASPTVLLSDYVPGEVLTADSIALDENLDALAALLRRLHALPAPARRFDAAGAARRYAGRSRSIDAARTRACLNVIEALPPPRDVACCHNDLVAANILAPPRVVLLDWEYACANDPCFDLATVVAHHGLGAAKAQRLLDAYCGGADEAARQRLEEYCAVYKALLWLWHAAEAGSNAGEA
ncbi:MAG: phosphotransferase [Woeseiaceae bacterium]|nr:phosphotransferase [Woeseiaceae bacterium]